MIMYDTLKYDDDNIHITIKEGIPPRFKDKYIGSPPLLHIAYRDGLEDWSHVWLNLKQVFGMLRFLDRKDVQKALGVDE